MREVSERSKRGLIQNDTVGMGCGTLSVSSFVLVSFSRNNTKTARRVFTLVYLLLRYVALARVFLTLQLFWLLGYFQEM